jgi:nucleoside-diphosphate-sugar epimerase
MNILVTGGAGFIGAILVPMLLSDKHEVTVLDSLRYDQPSLAHVAHLANLRIVRGDVRDDALLKSLMRDQDIIIPLAALVGAPLCDRHFEEARQVNQHHVFIVCQWAEKHAGIIFPATNSVYGTFKGPCNEDCSLRPLSHYAQTKVLAERMVIQRGNCISLRFATLFGFSPRMRTDLLVNDFVYRALTDRTLVLYEPDFKRSILHVRDAAAAIWHAINRFEDMSVQNRNIFNVACGSPTKRDIAEHIAKHIPGTRIFYEEETKDPDQRDCEVDCSRMAATGFSPKFSLNEGIAELVRGYPMLNNRRYGNV